MFVSTTKDLPAVVCEDCYFSTYYGNPSFVKAYKHYVLDAGSESATLAKYEGLALSAVGTADLAKAKALSTKLENLEEPQVPKWDPKQEALKSMAIPGPKARVRHHVATDPAADGDMPLFFRKSAAKDPFANVHMALRVGPLVVENGVAQ